MRITRTRAIVRIHSLVRLRNVARIGAIVRNSDIVHNRALVGIGATILGVCCGLFTAPITRGADEPSPTVIYDTILLGENRCTIQILSDPETSVCANSPFELEASFECLEGTQPVNEPQWFLDGSPVGTGTTVSLALELGSYLLQVSCGSCEDQIRIESVDCASQPRLDVLHCDDDVESTAGIFLRRNLGAVTPLNFGQLRFLMRPFSLSIDESVESGTVQITSVDDDVLDLFELDGTAILLPAQFDVADLPVDFLVSGGAFGDARIRATYSAAAPGSDPLSDEVRVRVGPWPGLSGRSLSLHPFFHYVDTFNSDGSIATAIDPTRHSERVGLPFDVYVVAHRSPGSWQTDNTLVDVTGSVESGSVTAGSIGDNIAAAWPGGLQTGSSVSLAYDIVYDFDRNGTLDPGDLIDGFSFEDAGAYVVKDLSLNGPFTVQQENISGGTWLTQRLYFPANIAQLGLRPLVTIGHGNGHQYTWYDYLGNHLASHGYVVMSYRNNTGPGIEAASTTTLTNIDYFVTQLGSIAGGILDGHVATDQIGWIGHSRGGEGVVRAYDRLYDGDWVPQGYTIDGIGAVASIAPTVYLTAAETDPHDVNYYLIVGGADGDVTGRPDLPGDQYFRISDRSLAVSQTSYVHGATHNDFNCCGFDDGIGPDQIGRPEAQRVAKSYFLALMQNYLDGNLATREYFTRMYDDLAPLGIAPAVEIASTFRTVNQPANYVIDDFQSEPSLTVSSSGGAVALTVANAYEGLNEDNNTSFTWTSSDPMNGMIFYSGSGDFSRGMIFDHPSGESRSIEFEVVPAFRDVRGHRYLSLRACQGTRHPNTVALDDAHSFSVTLRDEMGTSSTIAFGSWGKLTPLYPRTGSGTGAGWANEMNTVRIPLAAFETDGAGVDLSRIAAVRLEFGGPFGSSQGRIGLDDLQFVVQ